MEDFVSFDLAKKLKEKGFNAECHAYYEPLNHCLNFSRVFKTNSLAENYNCVAAPTISQVLKWLREKKKIYVGVSYMPKIVETAGSIKNDFYFYTIQKIGHFEPMTFGDGEDCNSYEEAAIKGIEYVIDNLI